VLIGVMRVRLDHGVMSVAREIGVQLVHCSYDVCPND
jgi:hypothetical protein